MPGTKSSENINSNRPDDPEGTFQMAVWIPQTGVRAVALTSRHFAAGAAGLGLLWLGLLFRYRYWIATNDMAILQLALEEMRDGRIPLVGTYSRLDFRHPGPFREWLFFFPYILSGGRSAALPASTVAFHTVMFAVAIHAGWRWRGTCGTITASVGMLVMYLAIGKELAVPWNPYMAATATFAAVWCLLAFLRTGSWVPVVVCASFAAQMHAPALPLAITVAGIVAIVSISRRLTAEVPPAQVPVRPIALRVAAVVGLFLLWTGPLIDATSSDSNVTAALDASRVGEPAGLTNALAFAGRAVNPLELLSGTFVRPSPEGLTGNGGLLSLTPWLVVGAIAVGIVTWRRDRNGQIDLAVMATLAAACVATMSRFVPEFYGHLFGSVTAAAVVIMTATVAVALTALHPAPVMLRGSIPKWQVVTAIVVVIMFAFTALGIRTLNSNVIDRRELAAVGAVAAVVEPSSTYAVTAGGGVASIVEAEVALTIERSGAEATSDIFSLALPADDGDSSLFIVGMTSTRQCLLEIGLGRIVLDGVIEKVQQPIIIVLVDHDERTEAKRCLPS